MIPSQKISKKHLEEQADFCYNASKQLDFYTLFPGHSLFVSVYHPLMAIEPKHVTGSVAFRLNAIAKIEEKIPRNCKKVEMDFSLLKKAHEDYENW